METIIMNGELYIKKAPSKSKYELQVPYFNIGEIKSNEVMVIKSAKDLDKLPPFIIEILEQNGIIKRSEKAIYDNAGFYQIYTDGNKIYMINRNTKQVITFNTLEETEKEFISLYEFLKRALYIGRQFGINGINQELIYSFENIYLLKMPFTDEYTVLDKNDPLIKNDNIGDILPVYYEKSALYKDIVQQEIKATVDNNGQRR